jgi:acyl-homoserine lactone acylase PvdQ
MRWHRAAAGVVVVGLLAAACSGDDDGGAPDGTDTTVPGPEADVARYVLPPGNDGRLPTGPHSLDQLPLYDGLTPLRDDITDADLEELYLPMDFEPIEPSVVEDTGRPGLEIVYDAYGIPHITGETRDDVAFGAGWITARDRDLLLRIARGPARAAVADVPGIDAFALVTSGQSFIPSAEAEALIDEQWELLIETYGEEGEQILADATAGAEGANAYYESVGTPIDPPINANDVLATTAFIGSIFGGGGGSEVDNASLLAELEAALGAEEGAEAWEDVMLTNDPATPTTLDTAFEYGPLTGGDPTDSVHLDLDSVEAFDPIAAPAAGAGAGTGTVDAAGTPPDREASNWLLVGADRSATGNVLAVQGPQLGYYYPEIVQQVHLSGPGFEAQGAAVPGLTMYILIGRTADYSWSLTSAGHDVRDVFVEELCEPDGSTPTRATTNYLFEGECRPMELFTAGALNGEPIAYQTTVHGPVVGTALVDGEPVALSRQRSTFGRDGLNLVALKQMTEGEAETAEDFFEVANRFEFTFNWSYASRTETAYFSSGRLPVRAEGLDRRLPTPGTGDHEWQGFLELDQHPHAVGGPDSLLLNWNNQSAPGFMHGDGEVSGPLHRVQLFDQFPDRPVLTDVVGVMNRAATEHGISLLWPTIAAVLAEGEAPGELEAEVVAMLDDWVERDAPLLDADDDGIWDEPAPAIIDAVWPRIGEAVATPVLGDVLEPLGQTRSLTGDFGLNLVYKDLRALLGEDDEAPFALSYCGSGDMAACATDLWAAVGAATEELSATLGDDPAAWLTEADRTGFVPDLIPDTIRRTNRPTYQQVLEFVAP